MDAQVLNVYAPYTLVRSATENAATAVWLLEPRKRSERLRRCLKLAHHEAREAAVEVHELIRKLFPAEALDGKRTAQERIDEIRTLAVQLSLDPNDILGRLSYEKVVRTAGEAIGLGGDLSAFMWRLCSGFAHGRYWASFSLLDRHVVASQGNVLNVRLSGDVEKLLMVAGFPFVFTKRALELYEQRRRSPYPG